VKLDCAHRSRGSAVGGFLPKAPLTQSSTHSRLSSVDSANLDNEQKTKRSASKTLPTDLKNGEYRRFQWIGWALLHISALLLLTRSQLTTTALVYDRPLRLRRSLTVETSTVLLLSRPTRPCRYHCALKETSLRSPYSRANQSSAVLRTIPSHQQHRLAILASRHTMHCLTSTI
jgi:hypothetical protein